jgi:hypothetical protein
MQGTTWGGVFVGTSITPFNPQGRIRLDPRRVTSNQFQGCLVPRKPDVCSALRGFDLRWQIFRTKPGKKYPRTLWYFRTGYNAGHADFEPESGRTDYDDDQAKSLSYLTVPLFLGGNIYLFDSFPVRPYAGAGFGFDVLRVDYRDRADGSISDVSARIGFELHAGIEARITNWVALTAEVQQLWSARKKIDTVPDFSNEGFTIITGVAIGFPIHDPPRTRVTRKKVVK